MTPASAAPRGEKSCFRTQPRNGAIAASTPRAHDAALSAPWRSPPKLLVCSSIGCSVSRASSAVGGGGETVERTLHRSWAASGRSLPVLASLLARGLLSLALLLL